MEKEIVPRIILTLLLVSVVMLTFNIQRVHSQPVHDIAVTNVVPSKTIVSQGYPMHINVTVENQGDVSETFDVTMFTNTTSIGSQTITLTSRASTNITFTWNTIGFAKVGYIISAYATPVPGETETDTADNTYTDGIVNVAIVGDVNGDGSVELMDFHEASQAFGSFLGHSRWNPNCDINEDGLVELLDFFIISQHFGQHQP